MLEEMHKKFPILIVDDKLDASVPGSRALQEIIDHLENFEYTVIKASTLSDGRLAMISHEDTGCVLLSWDLKSDSKDSLSTPAEFIEFIRKRNTHIPIFLLTEKFRAEDIPLEAIEQVSGYIWKEEDSPAFVAGRIKEAMERYTSYLLPPFFGELAKYVDEYKYAWHTPGHMGGMAFMKSPAGRIFFDFLGENVFRADLSVSVPELGSLMEHSGVVGDAEREAARIFGADKTYFVTNGTSTANHIVFNGCINTGDIILVDRNCHKSMMYSIILAGATPVYLMPTRNDYGIIGPVHADEFNKDTIKKKLENNPLTKNRVNEQIKLAVVTNSTYDGLCYNVDLIKDK
ncbi:MAG: lysine decarboxylase, partial [Nitrospiraceae bacterium]|nr:lysine decarboxylase [Nitrospiraceae bacterium]